MTDLRALSDEELTHGLRALGAEIDYPPQLDLSAAVAERISSPAPPRWLGLRWSLPRLVTAAAVVIALVGGLALFSDTARDAIADLLGVRGIRIFVDDDRESPSPRSIGDSLYLGRRTTLADARERAVFEVLEPHSESLGPPDQVYFDDGTPGGQVSFVYEPGDDLPETRETGVGLLISQFRGELDDGFYKKLLHSGTRLRFTAVDGLPAYWISGAPHVYIDPDGLRREDAVRLAANVLLWERGDITLRIESALPLRKVREIAGSIF